MLIIRTDQETYRPGETVLFTMTWRNETEEVREYLFPNAQRFDIRITRNGEKVWQWSDGRLFAQVMTTLILPPGDSRVFKAEWKQVDENGRPVPPGEYQAEAWIVKTEERGTVQVNVSQAVQGEGTAVDGSSVSAKTKKGASEAAPDATHALAKKSDAALDIQLANGEPPSSNPAPNNRESAAAKEPFQDRYRMYYGMWALHGYPVFGPFWLRPPMEKKEDEEDK